MTEAEIVMQLLTLGAQIGPGIAKGIEGVITALRPELLPPPPAALDGVIAAEDAARIAQHFTDPPGRG